MAHTNIYLVSWSVVPSRAEQAASYWATAEPEYKVTVDAPGDFVLKEWQGSAFSRLGVVRQCQLTRWSRMLTEGGWAIRSIVREKMPLCKIESSVELKDSECLINTMRFEPLPMQLGHVISCGPSWAGRQELIERVAEGLLGRDVLLERILHKMLIEHPDWFVELRSNKRGIPFPFTIGIPPLDNRQDAETPLVRPAAFAPERVVMNPVRPKVPVYPAPEEIERRRIERHESYSGLCPYCEVTFTSFESHKGHSPCDAEKEAQRLGLSPASYRVKPAAEKLGISLGDITHYATALARWAKAGFPTREHAEVERIEREKCRPCEKYADGRCKVCGCRVTASNIAVGNKIKMATESCPLDKW